MKNLLSAQNLLGLWMFGFIGSFLIQSIFQRWFAANTQWGANGGWQNEIAIWNVGVLLVVVPLWRSEQLAAKAIPGLAILSLCFGINHGIALLRSPAALSGNIAGFLTNAIAVVLSLIYFYLNRPKT